MGVTIHYRFSQEKKYVKPTLDSAEIVAKYLKEYEAKKEKIAFEITRKNNNNLLINIGNCESLVFDFKPVEKIRKQGKDGWNYEYSTLLDKGGIANLDADLYYCSAFCKTQFANNIIEHKWIADIIRTVASRCKLTEVYDEGDYYHSGVLKDAIEAISETGRLIDSVAGILGGLGYKKNDRIVVKKGETKIKIEKEKKDKLD